MHRQTPIGRSLSLALVAALPLFLGSCRGIGAVASGLMSRESGTPAPVATARAQRPDSAAHSPDSPRLAHQPAASTAWPVQPAAYPPPALPPGAYTGGPGPMPYYPIAPAPGWSGAAPSGPCSCPHCSGGPGGPFRFRGEPIEAARQCAPDGLACPWPADEYLCDGGDHGANANVRQDRTVVGVDQEDTVAHYETLDGQLEITPTNQVCIYAPRFAAVRKIVHPFQYEGHERMADVAQADKLNLHEEKRLATSAMQPEQLQADLAVDQALAFRERNRGIGLEASQELFLAQQDLLPYEDLQAIHRGIFENHEKARLAAAAAAAHEWETRQAVQIVIDGQLAVEGKGLAAPEETVVYELEGRPRLRMVKIADRADARPGEIIHFTLRFDNVGDQPAGSVTIIDNLTTRLEYVEGSQTCTLPADFATEENDGESLVLRWALRERLKVRQGGVIRFQCRVR